jgi:hypothetical protein
VYAEVAEERMATSARARLRLLKSSDFTPENTEALYTLFNDSIMHGGTIGFL